MSKHAAAWRFATLGALAASLSACGLWPTAPSDQAAAPATAAAAPVTAPAPMARPAAIRRTGSFRFEAERVAEGAGCYGPNQVRPIADRRSAAGGVELYDVQCASRVVQVRCDLGMCALAH